jgi:hypothetical protein
MQNILLKLSFLLFLLHNFAALVKYMKLALYLKGQSHKLYDFRFFA